MKSWLSLTAAALLAASLAPAALAQDGLNLFGNVCANSQGHNIILDLGGRPLEAGSRVELRRTYVRGTTFRTYVPFADDADIARMNPTIMSFPIGAGAEDTPGTFSVHLSSTPYLVDTNNRVQSGTNYFVVVFDPTEKYFRLSTNFCVVSGSSGINHYPTFRSWAAIDAQDPEHPETIVPLNTTDSDGDGLSDEFEASLGTDAGIADSDGDGFSDGFEYAHYMDPLAKYEPNFRLTTDYIQGEGTQALSEGGTLYDLTWNSGVGLPYAVEYTPAIPAGEQDGAWSNILTTNASDVLTIFNINEFIEDPNGAPAGFFRLWYPGSEDEATSD